SNLGATPVRRPMPGAHERGKGESSPRVTSLFVARPSAPGAGGMGIRRAGDRGASPMTQKKDLKRHVRERMAKTGERYATALRQVKAKVEVGPDLVAASYLLKAPWLKCLVTASREVYRAAWADEGAKLLERFAEVLALLEGDPTAVLFRRVVAGEGVHPEPT